MQVCRALFERTSTTPEHTDVKEGAILYVFHYLKMEFEMYIDLAEKVCVCKKAHADVACAHSSADKSPECEHHAHATL